MSRIVDFIDLTNCPDDVSEEAVANPSVLEVSADARMEISNDPSVLEINDSILEASADQSVIVVECSTADSGRSVKSTQTTSEVETKHSCAKNTKRCCCPICWEDYGKNPLISTKCGHIFCLKCFEDYLKYNGKCPTCRDWVGRNGYHRIYLQHVYF